MKELDLLKKDWNKNANFKQISEQELYGMLRKKSSSVVKWIFIISIIELTFGIILGLILSIPQYNDPSDILINNLKLDFYLDIISILSYLITIGFIIRFYKLYKRVSTSDATKLLMLRILKTRRVVKQYIIFNLGLSATVLLTFGYYILEKTMEKGFIAKGGNSNNIPSNFPFLSFMIIFLTTVAIIGLYCLFYYLIYGRLLRKLNNNYRELKNIHF